MAALTACHDDDTPFSGEEPSIEYDDQGQVSVFNLTLRSSNDLDRLPEAVFELADPGEGTFYQFNGSLAREGSLATCRMALGHTALRDGSYLLSVRDGSATLGTWRVLIRRNTLTEESYTPMSYDDLQGEGTEESPYLINDPTDFLILQSYLLDDPDHAYGLYFRQTDSFDLPHRSQIIDGKVWTAVSFSGHYDGANHELRSLSYQGGSDPGSDSGIGLFKSLFCADIRNLKLTNALITGAASEVGMIAGSASGSTSLSNVSVAGTILAHDHAGGLIGKVDGDLTLTDISLSSLAVQGAETEGNYIGGLVGSFTNGTLTIDGVSTPDHIFSVTGSACVAAGVGGISTTKPVTVSYATFEHTVDQESSGIKVIYGTGNVGTIAGELTAKDVAVSSVTVKAPVTSPGDDIGAAFGRASISGTISFDNTLLASTVTGGSSTGGFFGYLNLNSSSSRLNFKGSDNKNRYVVKQSAAAQVAGSNHVGAIAGYLEGNDATLRFDSAVEIAVNVSGTGQNVGGAFGYMRKATLEVDKLNFSSPTMRVEGESEAGGVAGMAESCTFNGPNSFDFLKEIPSYTGVAYSYGGVVKAVSQAGGIAGLFTGTLNGVASDASVTATGSRAGGIVANVGGAISSCAFNGVVSAPDYVAGIMAYSYQQNLSVVNCINYADIDGGTYQGGIASYINVGAHIGPTGIIILKDYLNYCINKGDLTGGKCVGGVVSAMYYTNDLPNVASMEYPIRWCANYGDIKAAGNADHPVGGVVGIFDSACHMSIRGCANHGKVSSTTVQSIMGGVAGTVGTSHGSMITVEECMNSGEVTCDVSSTKLGGVVGSISAASSTDHLSIVRNNYNTGALPDDQKSDTGGILAYASTYTDTHCNFNRGKVSHGNAIIGTHASGSIFYHSHNYYLDGTGGSWPSSTKLSASEISNESKYTDFDFKNVWLMTSEGPVLRNCPFQ